MSRHIPQSKPTIQASTLLIDGRPATPEEIERITRIPARKAAPRGDFQPRVFSILRKDERSA